MLKKTVANLLAGIMLLSAFAFSLGDAAAGEKLDNEDSLRLQGEIPESFYEDAVFSKKWVDGTPNSFTGGVYTHSNVFTGLNVINGIDISEWNTVTDWNAVKNAGIEYVFIRAAYRAAVSGNLLNDNKYWEHIKGATEAGLKVGIYIYSQAVSAKEAEAEADYLIEHVDEYTMSMPLILDFEYYSETGPTKGRLYDAGLTKAQATEVCNAFCAKVQNAGYYPMVYANSNMLKNHLNAGSISDKYPIWLANYTEATAYSGDYEFWQYSSSGKVSGITGNVDMNFWYTSDPDKYSSQFRVSGVVDMAYTGQPIVQNMTVTNASGEALAENVHYTVAYENNINVGTATIRITGIGAYANVFRVVTFNIFGSDITGFMVDGITKKSIRLIWEGNSNFTGYQIYRSKAVNGKFEQIAVLDGTQEEYKDTSLKSDREYYYYIKGIMASGASTKSEQIVARPKLTANKAIVTKSKYKLKNSTKSGAKKVATIPKNMVLSLISKAENKSGTQWYYVSYSKKGKTYFGYLPKSKAKSYKCGKTTTKRVNVRKGAGITKRLVCVVKKKGGKFYIMGQKKDSSKKIWYKVVYTSGKYTYKGYIISDYVKIY